MPKMTQDQAQGLAEQINLAERRMDGAIEAAALMLTGLTVLRTRGAICAETAQPSVQNLTEALSLMGAARGALVAAHRSMDEEAAKMDFEPFTGDGPPKPTGMKTVMRTSRRPVPIAA